MPKTTFIWTCAQWILEMLCFSHHREKGSILTIEVVFFIWLKITEKVGKASTFDLNRNWYFVMRIVFFSFPRNNHTVFPRKLEPHQSELVFLMHWIAIRIVVWIFSDWFPLFSNIWTWFIAQQWTHQSTFLLHFFSVSLREVIPTHGYAIYLFNYLLTPPCSGWIINLQEKRSPMASLEKTLIFTLNCLLKRQT